MEEVGVTAAWRDWISSLPPAEQAKAWTPTLCARQSRLKPELQRVSDSGSDRCDFGKQFVAQRPGRRRFTDLLRRFCAHQSPSHTRLG